VAPLSSEAIATCATVAWVSLARRFTLLVMTAGIAGISTRATALGSRGRIVPRRRSMCAPHRPVHRRWLCGRPTFYGGSARRRRLCGSAGTSSWPRVEGLLRDKTRKPGKPTRRLTVKGVIHLTLGPPRGETTHWTGRILAKAAGVSLRSAQRILEAHQLATHRLNVHAVEWHAWQKVQGCRRPPRRSSRPCRRALGRRG
jgi:hypothetical protein